MMNHSGDIGDNERKFYTGEAGTGEKRDGVGGG